MEVCIAEFTKEVITGTSDSFFNTLMGMFSQPFAFLIDINSIIFRMIAGLDSENLKSWA